MSVDLKTTINKTETNKDNVGKILNQINLKLSKIGDSKANNLSTVPEILDTRIKVNLKKVAIMNVSIDLDSAGGYWNAVCDIPIDLDFTPTRILMRYEVIERDTVVTDRRNVDSKYATTTDMDGLLGANEFAILNFNSKNIHVEHKFGNSAYGVGFARVKKIIAIG